jgi:hypothetical protein
MIEVYVVSLDLAEGKFVVSERKARRKTTKDSIP